MANNFNVWAPQGSMVAGSGKGNATVIYDSNPEIIGGTNVFKMFQGDYLSGSQQGQLNYYESADGLTSWTAYASNPVITGIFLPTVYKVNGTFYAYGSNSSNAPTQISCWTSTDGKSWTSKGVVISVGGVGAWDHTQVNQLNIIVVGGTWYGYYHGSNSGNNPPSALGLATSTDGIAWTKSGTSPAIVANGANTYGLGSGSLYQAGGLYYISVTKYPDSQTALQTAGATAIYNWTAPSPAGPWTEVLYNSQEIPALYLCTAADYGNVTTLNFAQTYQIGDMAYARNAVADPNGASIAINGNIYGYYTISYDFGQEIGTNAALASGITPSQLISTYQGMQNAPFFGQAALNLQALASDTFQRANANPIGGNWTPLGSSGGFGNAQIVSDLLEASVVGTAGDSYYAGTWANDQWSQATVETNTASYTGPDVRMSTSALTAYRFWWHPTGSLGSSSFLLLTSLVAGSSTTLCTINNFTLNQGDVLMLAIIGTNLMLFWNGFLIFATTTSAIASGKPGFIISAATSTANAQIDNWSAGTFQSAPIPTPPLIIGWSPVDSRIAVFGFGPGANTGVVDEQGNVIYSAQNPPFSGNSQVSDNSAIPPIDSRITKPIDSRSNIPVNSRVAPPFGEINEP